MSIFNHFPFTPRPGQTYVLEQIEKNWDRYDVFLIVAPTAFGKELCGTTIINWQQQGSFLVPNNLLLKQVVANNPTFKTMVNKAAYKHNVAYQQAKRNLKGSKCVLNYYQYLANRAYNKLLVIDEAHLMVEHLQGFDSIKLWAHLDGFEEGQFSTSLDLLVWLEEHKSTTARIKKAHTALQNDLDKYIIKEDVATYRGKQSICLTIQPLTPRDNTPIYWPRSVQKIVLMSATINDEDLYDLGLDRRRVLKIEAPSPIPVANRPLVYWPLGSMGHKSQEATLPKVVGWISDALKAHPQKGIVHTTYSINAKLQRMLVAANIGTDRLIFHNKFNKAEKFNEWIGSTNKVLIASGMYEGLDLAGDLARWQAVVKAPFPNLTEPAINAKLRQRPDSYAWSTLKQIVQSAGRVSRSPTDFGTTYFLDSDIGRLVESNRQLVPRFFLEAWDKNRNTK